MKFSALQNFLAVASELNITKAAQKLYITQQSLSESITRLEREYGVKLFERTPRLRLTYAGERMAAFAEEVLRLERQYRNEMADLEKESIGFLSVGTRNNLSRLMMTQIIPQFSRMHPNVHLKITYEKSKAISQLLANGQLDLCIGSSRFLSDPNFTTCAVIDDCYMMVVPENLLDILGLTKEEAENGCSPDYARLNGAPILMIAGDSQTRLVSDEILARYRVSANNQVLECSGMENCLFGASAGLGITFSPGEHYRCFCESTITRYPLYAFRLETTFAEPCTVICHHHSRPLSQAGKDFAAIAETELQAAINRANPVDNA